LADSFECTRMMMHGLANPKCILHMCMQNTVTSKSPYFWNYGASACVFVIQKKGWSETEFTCYTIS